MSVHDIHMNIIATGLTYRSNFSPRPKIAGDEGEIFTAWTNDLLNISELFND